MSIAEVERLWLRFKQLGCSEKGELSDEALAQHSTYQDAFSRNVRSPNGRSRNVRLSYIHVRSHNIRSCNVRSQYTHIRSHNVCMVTSSPQSETYSQQKFCSLKTFIFIFLI